MKRGALALALLLSAGCGAEAPPPGAPPVAAPRADATAPLRVRIAEVESSTGGAGGEVAARFADVEERRRDDAAQETRLRDEPPVGRDLPRLSF